MDSAVVLFDDGGHDGQAQTGAAGLAGTRGVGAVETLKDALAILAVNTGAVARTSRVASGNPATSSRTPTAISRGVPSGV